MTSISYAIVDTFEKTIAEYAGSKFAVAVDSCSNALFLCLKYRKADSVTIPKRTYPGVACAVKNSGALLYFSNIKWQGVYPLIPYLIIDGALRFKKGMYVKNSLHCLSFHAKKHLPIGRGGMILTDSIMAYEWLKRARFDGRHEVPLPEDKFDMLGWNMYMTPEQAARGLSLFEVVKDKDLKDIDSRFQGYPDLSQWEIYK